MSQNLYQATTELFYCVSSDATCTAQGELESDGPFRVFQGSTAKGHPNRIVQAGLVKNRVLAKQKDAYIFVKDYVFSAPSGAASTILGRNANGWEAWKNKRGRALGEIVRTR